METIYLIIFHSGTYEDKRTRVIKAYKGENEASEEMWRLNGDVGMIQGLCVAQRKLVDEWVSKNPSPEYETSRETYELWDNAKCDEMGRLGVLLGIEEAAEKLGIGWNDIESTFYRVQIVELE
jgi:hypothetical protein